MGTGRSDAEDQRAVFQSRLVLLGRWSFIVSGAFFVILRAVRLIFGVPFDRALWFHVVATVIAGAMWTVASRGG